MYTNVVYNGNSPRTRVHYNCVSMEIFIIMCLGYTLCVCVCVQCDNLVSFSTTMSLIVDIHIHTHEHIHTY